MIDGQQMIDRSAAGVVLLAVIVGVAAAQTTTSGAEDKTVLLDAAAAANAAQVDCAQAHCAQTAATFWTAATVDCVGECVGECVELWTGPNGISRLETQSCPLTSWTAASEPCGEGHDNPHSGWLGVTCDARDGRVVGLGWWGVWSWSRGIGLGGELLPFFARLGALRSLELRGNPALRGDVAELAGATELRELDLRSCPMVQGEAEALAALPELGGEYTLPCNSTLSGPGGGCIDDQLTRTGSLWLDGSGVHGPVVALRALPGLGADWDRFSACSAFVGYTLVHSAVECLSGDSYLGTFTTVGECAAACGSRGGNYFIFGINGGVLGDKAGKCYVERTATEACPEGFEDDSYDFYALQQDGCSAVGPVVAVSQRALFVFICLALS
jgi:hypothetical protein